jgi:hypothetical protein
MSLMLAEPAPRKPPDTMTATSYDLHGIGVLACAPDGKNLRSDRDAVELIAEAIQHEAGLILIPVERFADDFFRLNTRIAGEIIQKFVTYRRRLAIVGDISRYMEESSAFRDFGYEANRGDHVLFVANPEELDKKTYAHAAARRLPPAPSP